MVELANSRSERKLKCKTWVNDSFIEDLPLDPDNPVFNTVYEDSKAPLKAYYYSNPGMTNHQE